MTENEIVLQKWKGKIHTSAIEDENAIDDHQMREKRDHENDDHQSAQTARDRVDVRKRMYLDVLFAAYKYYSTNFDCQFKTELDKV